MAKRLTIKAIEALQAPNVRREIPDAGAPGLRLVLQPSGAKSWAYRYRSPVDARPKKLTIGRLEDFGLAEAREEAGKAGRAIARGVDPADAKRASKAAARDTSNEIGHLLDAFVARHVDAKNRPSTAAEVKRLIDKRVRPVWEHRKATAIARRDVISLIEGMADGGAAVSANRLLAILKRFFGWLVEREVLTSSPAVGVKKPAEEVSRDRVLTDDEIRLIWAATADGSNFSAIVRLLLLTGQRRGEVGGMLRAELEVDPVPIWTIPGERTKNGRLHVVPLPALALTVVNSVPRIARSRLVFTGDGKTPVSGWSKGKSALDRRMLAIAHRRAIEAGRAPDEVVLPPWRLHDLRRTVASGMASLGEPVHVVEAVLNHATGSVSGVAAVYNRYSYLDEKRHALEAWCSHVKATVDG